MTENTYIFLPNSPQQFSCEYCDFVTSNKKVGTRILKLELKI